MYEEHEVIRKGNRREGVRTGPTSVRTVFFAAIFPLFLRYFVT
jgi:hypothetical protein